MHRARTMRKLVAAMGLAVLAAPAEAAPRGAVPASIAVTYDVSRNGLQVAVVNERFESGGGRFRIVSESAPVGVAALIQPRPAVLSSAGRLTVEGLQPERFEGSRGANDPRRVNAAFDWAGTSLTLMYDGKNQRLELPAGTQDRLSIMYQFMFYSYDGPREIAFPMTNGRKLDRYRYAINPEVEIDTPLGRMKTLHLVKQREAGDSETEIWLAPQYLNLPVKMVIVESDGVRYEQSMTHIEVQP